MNERANCNGAEAGPIKMYVDKDIDVYLNLN